MMNHYASDSMGGGSPLKPEVQATLIDQLKKYDKAFTLLAYENEQIIGLTNCFETLSTFAAKPIINIHDLAVHSDYRGKGIGKQLLGRVTEIAIGKDCCKLTLEVLDGNKVAKSLYEKLGFKSYVLDPKMGNALFLEKKLI